MCSAVMKLLTEHIQYVVVYNCPIRVSQCFDKKSSKEFTFSSVHLTKRVPNMSAFA